MMIVTPSNAMGGDVLLSTSAFTLSGSALSRQTSFRARRW